jgi:hypothetical protein
MTPKHRITLSALALLAFGLLAGHARHATAQDSDKPREGAPAREDDAPSVVFDPTLVERLQELQAAHRRARDEALKDPKAWEDARAERAKRDRAELGQLWENLVISPDAQARLRMHADHMARLNRMLDLAHGSADAALGKRLQAAVQAELVQHAQNMQSLRAALRLQ